MARLRSDARQIVGRTVIEMAGRQPNLGSQGIDRDLTCQNRKGSSPKVAPGQSLHIVPAAVVKVPDDLIIRVLAHLATTLSPLEPDHRRKLPPAQWVEPAVLGSDRHRGSWSRVGDAIMNATLQDHHYCPRRSPRIVAGGHPA